MATAGTLEYLISVDSSKVSSGLSSAESKVKGFGNKLNAWTVAKGQMLANFAEKAASMTGKAFTSVIKGSVNAFKNYEQLVGGVDTLFKESSKKVQINAEKAFKTAGISANKYMETVTAFSASLLQSLGGDTSKAADVADMAIQDMSDNANKMGTSMESIQNAYQGFAKQNYTMLDNLKLGYGGTKKEMERLLEDAGKLTGKEYDISNLADIFEAIHAIQEELGITGTTKLEAETTIEGSLNSAKAAWEDMLTAIGRGEKLSSSMLKFKQSAKTLIGNLKPVIQRSIKSAFSVAQALLPEIKEVFGTVLDTVKNVIFDNLPETVKEDLSQLKQAFQTGGVVGILKSAAEILKTKFSNALKSTKIKLAESLGIEEGENASWSDIGKKILSKIKTAIVTAAKNLKIGVANLVGIEDASNATWSKIGQKIIANIKTSFKNIKLKVADLLKLESPGNQTWGDIATKIMERIKGGFSDARNTVKLKLANLLGFTNEDGTAIEDDDQVSWEAIAKAALTKIKAAFFTASGDAKVKLANLLGLTNEDGAAIDDGDMVSWYSIAQKAIEKIKTGFAAASTNAKLKLSTLLGLTNDDGTAIEDGDEISWTSIAAKALEKLKTGLTRVSDDAKIKIGDLLNIENPGEQSWADIGMKIMNGLSSYIGNKGNFIKQLILGNDFDPDKSTWLDVGEKITGYLKEAFADGGILNALLTSGLDNITGISTIAGKILTGFAEWVSNNSSQIVAIITNIASAMAEAAGPIVEALAKILSDPALWEGLGNALTEVLTSILKLAFPNMFNTGSLSSGTISDLMYRYEGARSGNQTTQDKFKANLRKALKNQGFENVDDILGKVDFSKTSEEMRSWLESLSATETSTENLATSSSTAAGNVDTLASAAAGAASTLSSIQAPTWLSGGKVWSGGHGGGLGGSGDSGGSSPHYSNAKGLWSVPYDNYISELHRGEMVLTASQARQYKNGGSSIDYDTLTSSIISAIQSGMAGATVRSYLSGKDITNAVNKRTAQIIKSKRYAT